MTGPKARVAGPLLPAGMQVLEEAGVILVDDLAQAEGVLSMLTEPIDAAFFERAPLVRVVSNHAVGYNNIDVPEATRRKVMICNTPGVLDDTTAELTWALILAVARRVCEGDRYVRSGRFTAWDPNMLLGRDLAGSVLGLVGYGRIGKAVARRADAFGMRVIHCGRSPDDLEALLQEADFVSLHVPLNQHTHHLIGRAQLRLMKREAYLINTSRGPVVDEAALVEALQQGSIAGAGLDVYENEPEVHPGLLELEQVVLVPHIGSATVATRNAMARLAATNLALALRGERPLHLVNPEVLD